MPGLWLQPPRDTPCTLGLGALASAAVAALAASERASGISQRFFLRRGDAKKKRRRRRHHTGVSRVGDCSLLSSLTDSPPSFIIFFGGRVTSGTGGWGETYNLCVCVCVRAVYVRRGSVARARLCNSSLLSSFSPPPHLEDGKKRARKKKSHNCSSVLLLPFLLSPGNLCLRS